MTVSHPIPEELLAACLAGRAEAAARQAVGRHLRACRECARRVEALGAWQEVLAWTVEDAPAPPAVRSAMQEALPRRSPRRTAWAAAAAVLLAASLLLLTRARREGPPAERPPSPPPPSALASVETREHLRVLAPSPGTQVLVGPRSSLTVQEDALRLAEGTCWMFTEGDGIRAEAGGLAVRMREGEMILQRRPPASAGSGWMAEALAAPSDGAEVSVLSGWAEAFQAGEGRPLRLEAGQALRHGQAPRAIPAGGMARLRESVLDSAFPAVPGLPAGDLDGRRVRAARLAAVPGPSYQARLRLRALDPQATLGFCFVVDGKSGFWALEGGRFSDGAWHTLHAVVSEGWVILVADGAVCHRVRRRAFKPNPVEGLTGIGPVVWGGRLDASRFSMGILE